MVFVIAELNPRKGKEEEVKKAMLKMVSPTVMETGCIYYYPHDSMDKNNSTLFFTELWLSESHLEEHLNTEHFISFQKKLAGILEVPMKVTKLNKLNNS
ncbi:putative quinol monooxygenase [Chryseobacterium culicis]|uniref:ABM domain-containing protein n=1 Tax=Chryseobacterium culicis TaxID=680127 RepID=A0A2S9CMS0_CHRCI|nr:putative quinol monooxygenase [Chryseobacterium culicis]PRB81784.1 hypothetical protein CQ022_19115 [Chryseobacterium culicis]PRB88439.1 hypothetical protein CQ033_18020 [Chryseobacterium culicis]